MRTAASKTEAESICLFRTSLSFRVKQNIVPLWDFELSKFEFLQSKFLGLVTRGCRIETIIDKDPCKSDLNLYFFKSFIADNFFYFYPDLSISNNIGHIVAFKKSKTTSPFNRNKASTLSYLNGILTKLPGEHFPWL